MADRDFDVSGGGGAPPPVEVDSTGPLDRVGVYSGPADVAPSLWSRMQSGAHNLFTPAAPAPAAPATPEAPEPTKPPETPPAAPAPVAPQPPAPMGATPPAPVPEVPKPATPTEAATAGPAGAEVGLWTNNQQDGRTEAQLPEEKFAAPSAPGAVAHDMHLWENFQNYARVGAYSVDDGTRQNALYESIAAANARLKALTGEDLPNPMLGGFLDEAAKNLGYDPFTLAITKAGNMVPNLTNSNLSTVGIFGTPLMQEQFRLYQERLNQIAQKHGGMADAGDAAVLDAAHAGMTLNQFADAFIKTDQQRAEAEYAKSDGSFLPWLASGMGSMYGSFRNPINRIGLMVGGPEIKAASPIVRTLLAGASQAVIQMGLTGAQEPGREARRAQLGQETGFWPVVQDEVESALGGFVPTAVMHGMGEIWRQFSGQAARDAINAFLRAHEEVPIPGQRTARDDIDEWLRRQAAGDSVWNDKTEQWEPKPTLALPAPGKEGPAAGAPPAPPAPPPPFPGANEAHDLPDVTSVTKGAVESAEADATFAPPVDPDHTPGDVLRHYEDSILHGEDPDHTPPPMPVVHTPDAPASPVHPDGAAVAGATGGAVTRTTGYDGPEADALKNRIAFIKQQVASGTMHPEDARDYAERADSFQRFVDTRDAAMEAAHLPEGQKTAIRSLRPGDVITAADNTGRVHTGEIHGWGPTTVTITDRGGFVRDVFPATISNIEHGVRESSAPGAPAASGGSMERGDLIEGKPVTTNVAFDPLKLKTDAEAFQYKGGGDPNGVTKRLAGVEAWNPMADGKIVVYERSNGDRIVADGHQRRGLARHLDSQGRLPKGTTLIGTLFKESDGWTPADVRAHAAKKNIGEGGIGGSVIDTARVLRDRPDLWDKSLPTSEPFMKQAKGLAELSDAGWSMVLNGQVKPNHAAIVGLGVPDKTKHTAILDDMVKFKPTDENAARMIVADANMAGFHHEEMSDLFGATEVARTLAAERAEVFSQVMKVLKNEKRVFSTLDREHDRIEKVGNALTADNAAIASRAERLGMILEKLATRHGPVSAALNKAAANMADGMAAAHAARLFLKDVERLIEEEGLRLDNVSTPNLEPRTDIDTGTPAGQKAQTAELEAAEARRRAKEDAERKAAEEAGAAAATPVEPMLDTPQVDQVHGLVDQVTGALDASGTPIDQIASGLIKAVQPVIDELFPAAAEQTDAGEQGIIPGVAPVTDKDRTDVGAAKPLTGGNAPPPEDGLFGSALPPDMPGLLTETPATKDGVELHSTADLAGRGLKPKRRADGSDANGTAQVAWAAAQDAGKPATAVLTARGWSLLRPGEKAAYGQPRITVTPEGVASFYGLPKPETTGEAAAASPRESFASQLRDGMERLPGAQGPDGRWYVVVKEGDGYATNFRTDGSDRWQGLLPPVGVDWTLNEAIEDATRQAFGEPSPPLADLPPPPEPAAPATRLPPHLAEIYDRARAVIVGEQNASPSFLQRKLQIPYVDAVALIMEHLDREGAVTREPWGESAATDTPAAAPAEQTGPRELTDLSEAERKSTRDAARYLQDFAYSTNALTDDPKAIARLATMLGKSGRDTLLMDAFNITRDAAHSINSDLDSTIPRALRRVDMENAFKMFPGLERIVYVAGAPKIRPGGNVLNDIESLPDNEAGGEEPGTSEEAAGPDSAGPADEEPAGYGDDNTFVKKDRAEKLRERLKAKLREAASRLNSGIDPEMFTLGAELGAYHIEAGARSFAKFVKAMMRDLDSKIEDLRPYLRGWYNGARDMMEDHSLDISGTDSSEKVQTELARLLAEDARAPAPTSVERPPVEAPPAPPPAKEPRDAFVEAIKTRLASGEQPFKTIVEARQIAKGIGLDVPEGASANKLVDELVERAVVEHARSIVEADREAGAAPGETFARMVALYGDQPNLSTRTSASVAEQAYSTPVPLAYVASRLAGIGPHTRVIEPTAGNGMLLMEADPKNAVTNELNPTRAAALEAQGFHPTTRDATSESLFADRAGQMDAVIANPPFGIVRDGGEARVFHVGDFDTNQVDHAIALNALKTMKADGRAVLIVGGVMAEDPAERAKGYQAKAKRRFYHQLLSQYKVADVFTVSGDLYSKQGAGFPVDVIVIHGRGPSTREPLTKTSPPLLKTWDEVGAKLHGIEQGEPAAPRPAVESGRPGGSPPAEGAGRPEGNGVGGKPSRGGGSVDGQPTGGQGESGDVGGGGPRREPGDLRPKPPVGEGAGAAPGEGGDVRQPYPGPDPSRRRPLTGEAAEAPQTPYEPSSQQGVKLNTLVPTNLRDATFESLDRVEREKGNIDVYVARALGRKVEDLGKFFSAEQIDAIALGLSNIEKGDGFVLGDQTGIGKGRVVAAMITYAKQHGMAPVFVTEKPSLFGDMWRDLHDIGWHEQLGRPINMVMTNSNIRVPLDEEAVDWIMERDEAKAEGREPPPQRGTFSKAQSLAAASEKMGAVAAGRSTPDVVFTTYDQMNSVGGDETDRRRFLRAISPRAFLIMDEAHNAGGVPAGRGEVKGAPPRSDLFREVIPQARAVLYSSATYAKSPSVMTLYSRTDMAKAVDNVSLLPELITKGGVPLQQAVAAMLAKSGQYARRERSFEGVTYDQHNVPVDEKSYEEFTTGLRSVFNFDRGFAEERAEIAQQLAAEEGGGSAHDTGVGDASASSTSFSSVMHNVINQMVVALKAEKTAALAVDALKAGEKPIIALTRTNESFIDDFLSTAGLKVSDQTNINFSDIMKAYLERTRRVTIKLGDDTKKRITIPLHMMSASAQAAYHHAEDVLREVQLGDLPISPIDAMRNVIRRAGFAVREITGRSTMLDYSVPGEPPRIMNRPAAEKGTPGKAATVKMFNDGKLDAIILNGSGSTGLSLHASSKFKDQRRRRMFLLEPNPNIDTFMQTLGRIHRTGQVITPAYVQVAADIPAEVRPSAVLMRKMASLNANTTGAAKSRFTSESVDFLNRYGDAVVQSILRDDPMTHMLLGLPQLPEEGVMPGIAAKATGRLTLLTPDEQQAFLDRITDAYKGLIAELDASGTNDLEAKSMDLQAQILDSQIVRAARGSSPFQAAVNLDRVSVKSQGRAMAPEEAVEYVAKALKTDVKAGIFATEMTRLERLGRSAGTDMVVETARREAEHIQAVTRGLKESDAKDRARAKSNENLTKFRQAAAIAYPGSIVTLHMAGGLTTPAVVIGFAQRDGARSPVALSSWEVTFAIPDGTRSLGLPLSRIAIQASRTPAEADLVGIERHTDLRYDKLGAMFEQARKEGREERFMFSGNMLAGFDATGGGGQIVTHTMADGTTRPAILMSRAFRADKFMKERAVRFTNGEHLIAFLDAVPGAEVKSVDGIIKIRKDGWRYEFQAPSAAPGRKYYADSTVRDVYDNWQRRGAVMAASVPESTARGLVDALMHVDAVFETRTSQDLATSLAPKPVEPAAEAEKGNPVMKMVPDIDGQLVDRDKMVNSVPHETVIAKLIGECED